MKSISKTSVAESLTNPHQHFITCEISTVVAAVLTLNFRRENPIYTEKHVCSLVHKLRRNGKLESRKDKVILSTLVSI